jgi:hypothetical protein
VTHSIAETTLANATAFATGSGGLHEVTLELLDGGRG